MTAAGEWLQVDSIDLDAQGVARNSEGKVVFIDGALPGERVLVHTQRKKNNWEQAALVTIGRESSQRVRPGCEHFGLHAGACGGCKMQHLHAASQVAVKQRTLEDNLWHLGKVKPERVMRPVEGPTWGYRYRARLSVRHVIKKGVVLIGFHERKSRYVADMRSCAVLPPHISAMLLPLRELIASMEARERLPQIELAVGESDRGLVNALVLRNLEPLSAGDAQRLRDFALVHPVQWWLQPKGPDTVHLLDEGSEANGPPLAYSLPEYGVTMPFKPTDFTQVNHHINRVLVGKALGLLAVQPGERVIDWFCGLGNFTLPLATQAREVLGIEGSETLVQRSRDNAALNGLAHKASFAARNLFELDAADLAAYGHADRWLIDPPREGAFALTKALTAVRQQPIAGYTPPQRIVYVSCNPATLARDAGLLVHQGGYRCVAAGAVNMFPHTAHVESIAVFERIDGWTLPPVVEALAEEPVGVPMEAPAEEPVDASAEAATEPAASAAD
ncbi:MAG: 23S rRNA (uracil(1939)-C(5))-methyltransferase RlmD [Leptothrix sp. (in: b-proteobacteria)]